MAFIRNLLVSILVFLASFAKAQQIQYLGGANTRIVSKNQFQVDSLFVLPQKDTNFIPYRAGAIVYRVADKKFYMYDGDYWQTYAPSYTSQMLSYSDAKKISAFSSYLYKVNINNQPGDFKYDPTDVTTADDTAMTIVTNGGARLKRVVEGNTLDPRWFGAIPNDGVDDYAAIQKCINYAIKNGYKKISIPAGQFILSKGLLLWKDSNNDGFPEFVNLSIEGAGKTHGGSNLGETELFVTNRNNFGLGIMRGKGCSVKNINIVGTNQLNYNLATAWNQSTTYIKDSQRNNQYSPYAGIVIDPFGSNDGIFASSSNKYPGFESYYAVPYNTLGNGGSTNCSFENIVVNGFVCGIILSPNGQTQNNESNTFSDIWIDNCKNAFVTCNSQERNTIVRNIRSWNSVQSVFASGDYGAGRGDPPSIDGANIAGSVFQIFYISGWGMQEIDIKNIFAESFYRLGKIANVRSTSFDGCNFNFGLTTHPEVVSGFKVQDWLYWGGRTSFNNSVLVFYEEPTATPMNFLGGPFKFDNCYLNNPIGVHLNQFTINNSEVSYSNCGFYTLNNSLNDAYHWSEFFGYKFYAGNKMIDLDDINVTYSYPQRYYPIVKVATQYRKVTSAFRKWISLGTYTVTVTADSASATIPSLAGKSQFVGKLIFDNYEGPASGAQAMRIRRIDSSGNVTFDKVVDRATSGAMGLWIEDYQTLRQPYLFDYNGTALSNVIHEGDTSLATIPISWTPQETGIYYYNSQPITFNSSSAGAATPAWGLYNNVIKRGILSPYDYQEYGYTYGNPLINGFFSDGVLFTEGALYENVKTTGADSLIYAFKCTKSGVKGSRLAPEFEVVYKTNINNGSYSPAFTKESNTDSAYNTTLYYSISGNTVSVWGAVTLNATAANTYGEVSINLPIAATGISSDNLSGTGVSTGADQSLRVYGNSGNKAVLGYKPTTADNTTYQIQFSYRITN